MDAETLKVLEKAAVVFFEGVRDAFKSAILAYLKGESNLHVYRLYTDRAGVERSIMVVIGTTPEMIELAAKVAEKPPVD
jgi:voltage-gated potassium channel Kch